LPNRRGPHNVLAKSETAQIQLREGHLPIRLAIEEQTSKRNPRWVERCTELSAECAILDCYDSAIISRLHGFDGLVWHFFHSNATDLLMARHVIASAERMGLRVFPDIDTCWHFDDKIAQKYVLEALGAPIVPTHVFYDKNSALEWLREAGYPLVRKLRRGAGSVNVALVSSFAEAVRHCDQMFGEGSTPAPAPFADSRRRIAQMLRSPRVFYRRVVGSASYLRENRIRRRELPIERGYVLFQDFVPNNAYDIRVTVVGDRAWGFTRDVRPGDFRASGSGRITYVLKRIPLDCVRIAFEVSRALCAQSTAFDFVMSSAGHPQIVEISYGYDASAIHAAPGHWSGDLTWNEGRLWPQDAIISDLVESIRQRPDRTGMTAARA